MAKRRRKRSRSSPRAPGSASSPASAAKAGGGTGGRGRRALVVAVVLTVAVASVVLLVARRPASEGATGAAEAGADSAAGRRPIPLLESRQGVDPLVLAAVDDAVAEVELHPEDGKRWGELGRLYQATEYHSLARRAYQAAAELAAADPSWPYYLAVDAARRGDVAEAIGELRRTLALDPDYDPALLRLGDALLAAGDLDAAEEAFGEYTAREPQQAWGHLGLGRVARHRGRLEEAARHLEQALTLSPAVRQAAYLLAMTYRELGRGPEAEALLADLSDDEGRPPDPLLAEVRRRTPGLQAQVRRANDRLAAGDLEGAAALYRQVLDVDPDHYTALVNLGNVYGRQRRTGEALALLRRAVGVDPDNPHAHYGLALALLSLGRTGEARAQLDTVLRLDPTHPHAGELRARLAR